jgi:uncharacterized protein
MLKVEVKDLKDGPVTLVVDESPEFFDLSDDMYQFSGRVTGEITFRLVKNDVTGKGRVEAHARCLCVRCLEPVELHLSPDISLIYSSDPMYKKEIGEIDIEREIVNYYDGKAVYPRDQIREFILLELPNFPTCRADCSGLCPHCGRNLNYEECGCAKMREASPPLESSDWKTKLNRLKKKL